MYDTQELVELPADVMKKHGHRHIFWSEAQFSPWTAAFKCAKESMKTKGSREEVQTKAKMVFGIDSKTPVYVRDKWTYTEHLSRLSMHHVSMTENTPLFWLASLSKIKKQKTVDYHTLLPYGLELPSTTNVLTGIPRMSLAETVFDMDKAPGKYGRSSILRPVQKLTALMMYIERKLTKPGGIKLETCAGTGAHMRVCLLEPCHRESTRCDADIDGFTKLRPFLITILA